MIAMETSQSPNALDLALLYAGLGLPVFPVHTPDPSRPNGCTCEDPACGQIGKHPRSARGFYDATTDTSIISDTWEFFPEANIGIRTGAVAGIVVLDIDPKHDGYGSIARMEAQHGPLPETWTARTGSGGQHRVFRHPGGRVSNDATGFLAPGIDIRADGGYIVAAPSLHASGGVYAWLNEAPIAELPAAWVELLPRPKEPVLTVVPPLAPNDGDGAHWLDQAILRARKGNRNLTGFWLACQLRDSGYGEAEAGSFLDHYVRQVGAGDYSAAEAYHSLANAYQRPARERARSREQPRRLALVREIGGRRVDTETGEVLEDSMEEETEEEEAPKPVLRPRVIINDQREMITGICTILQSANEQAPEPFLYSHAGGLATLAGELGARGIQPLGASDLNALVGEYIKIMKRNAKGELSYGRLTRLDLETLISSCRKDQTLLPAPVLHGVAHTPFIDTSGRAVTANGFDPATGIYLDAPSDVANLEIPETPTAEQIHAARALLEQAIINEFAWADQASIAHAWAALLTPSILHILPTVACVPLLLINKPAPGSGATYFAQIIGTLYTGMPPVVTGAPAMEDNEEWGKTVASILRDPRPVAILDNVTEPIGNAVLMALFTSRHQRQRLLGGMTMLNLVNDALWIATGNNAARPKEDMIRRTVLARIDTGMERPEDRSFKREPLTDTLRMRRELMAALLTVTRAYFAAGSPPTSGVNFVGFNEWARLVGGVLQVIGVGGFLTNRAEMRSLSDEEGDSWCAFLKVIAEWQPAGGFRVGGVLVEVKHNWDNRLLGYNWITDAVKEAAPEDLKAKTGQKNLMIWLAEALKTHLDRPYGEYILRRRAVGGGSPTYKVAKGEGLPTNSEGLPTNSEGKSEGLKKDIPLVEYPESEGGDGFEIF